MSTQTKKGFALFFAILVASLTLAIGFAIYDLVTRELRLTTITAQSQYAIYAADAGMECALYWDTKYQGNTSIFGSSATYVWPASGSGIFCSDTDISLAENTTHTYEDGTNFNGVSTEDPSSQSATTTFKMQFLPQPYCAVVQVIKSNPSATSTVIISRGFNNCARGVPNQVERAFRSEY